MADTLTTPDTFPRLLLHHAKLRPHAPSLREKDLGIWQTWTWGQVALEVKTLACGLAAAGLTEGAHFAVLGDNRPRLYMTMMAVQCLGAIPVPLYQDAVADEMLYVFKNAEIAYALAEDQEQVDKLLEVRAGTTGLLTHIYYDDPRGLRRYSQPGLCPYEQLLDEGRAYMSQHPQFFEDKVASISAENVAALFYTSGTTGYPKGVVHTHRSLINRASAACRLENLSSDEEVLAYLPPAWIGQNIFSYAQAMVSGFCVNCPESAETVAICMREIGPTYYFAPPRVLEAMLTSVTIRMEDASSPKRWMFSYFMGVAGRVGERLLNRENVNTTDRILYALGDLCVYGPLRNVLGMSRVRIAYTAGEAIGPDLFRFYRSLGINLKQLYGSTETAVFVCVQPDGQVKAESVGVPVDGVKLKLGDKGEVWVHSPGLLKEYYKNPQATAEVLDAEGWYRTGDAGYFDSDGHLHIIDRAKDVGRLADNALFAPKYIENKLKFFPFIKEAVAFGDGKTQVCAFINIDIEAVGNWAERRNIAYSGYVDLAGRDEVLQLVRDCVGKVNQDLAVDPALASSQICRFVVLHKELDADDGELTRTRKVRRGFIGEKYQILVAALYSDKTEQFIETQVRFEDGREGSVNATLKIIDVPMISPLKKAA